MEKNRESFTDVLKDIALVLFPTKTYEMNKANRLINFTRTHSPGSSTTNTAHQSQAGELHGGLHRHSRQELEDKTMCTSSNMSSAEPLLVQYLIPHGLCQSGTGDTKVLGYIRGEIGT